MGYPLTAELHRKAILSLVQETADRMRDPEAVKSAVLHPDNQHPEPLYPEMAGSHWMDLSLASGYPAVMLLLAELDHLFPNDHWDAAVHAYVLKVKEAIEKNSFTSSSLFGGIAGVCFALQQSSRGGTRYNKMLASLNALLLQNLQHQYIDPLKENLRNRSPSPFSLYDPILGISGIGVYCLNNLSQPNFADCLEEILHLLIALIQPIEAEGRLVPGWYTPSHFLFLEEERRRCPKGNFNLGLAHGIPGILAFLAIAALHGVVVEGQMEAVKYLSVWIQNHRSKYNGAYFWKTTISFEEEMEGAGADHAFSGRDAWCYGTPGVARSLFLAGKALQDEQLKAYALDSFLSVFSRTAEERHLPGPTFCHGISGLLMITHKMAQESSSIELQKHVNTLTKDLLNVYHAEHPFGFKDLEAGKNGKYAEIDQAGLIEGASGILLTLLSLEAPTSWWHGPFLIGDCG